MVIDVADVNVLVNEALLCQEEGSGGEKGVGLADLGDERAVAGGED